MSDFIAVVPFIAATIIGMLTVFAPGIPRWRRNTVGALSVVIIGATLWSNWATTSRNAAEREHRAMVREKLGEFLAEGQVVLRECENKDRELPLEHANDWARRAEEFLATLGPSYVARFRNEIADAISMAGANQERNGLWHAIRSRNSRLDEFMREFAA